MHVILMSHAIVSPTHKVCLLPLNASSGRCGHCRIGSFELRKGLSIHEVPARRSLPLEKNRASTSALLNAHTVTALVINDTLQCRTRGSSLVSWRRIPSWQLPHHGHAFRQLIISELRPECLECLGSLIERSSECSSS